ncbi:PREDICTED: uncharacterized protein LOC108446629 [Corvus brachyrhynchos]|uniref:uncharacterized protein LOC108446629 n=1 Tax=Corvus brachyrhynchos TaxID=85066 RepID=UPI00081649F2|nr:PREDICTED: uncharacterized protein LOC108446629 [Corvus brachyrhynchos]
MRKQSGKNVQFEKEDKGSSQENIAFDDTDSSDSQIAFARLMYKSPGPAYQFMFSSLRVRGCGCAWNPCGESPLFLLCLRLRACRDRRVQPLWKLWDNKARASKWSSGFEPGSATVRRRGTTRQEGARAAASSSRVERRGKREQEQRLRAQEWNGEARASLELERGHQRPSGQRALLAGPGHLVGAAAGVWPGGLPGRGWSLLTLAFCRCAPLAARREGQPCKKGESPCLRT